MLSISHLTLTHILSWVLKHLQVQHPTFSSTGLRPQHPRSTTTNDRSISSSVHHHCEYLYHLWVKSFVFFFDKGKIFCLLWTITIIVIYYSLHNFICNKTMCLKVNKIIRIHLTWECILFRVMLTCVLWRAHVKHSINGKNLLKKN
jgi:hypothetical protein